MRLGFIGTGKIASSVITGICNSKISFQKILISRRNKNIARNLEKKFKKVYIAKSNQEIVDKCNWIFLAVTPKIGKQILPKLKFSSNQKVIASKIYKLIIKKKNNLITKKMTIKQIKDKIRSEIKSGLEKDKILNEEDKILLYKFYLKIKNEFKEIEKN